MVCKNCKRLLPQQINYCNGCGAKVIKNRLTIRNLFEDFAYRYLNYDNKFFQTILHLFKKPEIVIESYINGTRRKFTDPISFFAIALTIAGLQLFIIQTFFPNAFDVSSFSQPGMEGFQKSNVENLQKYQSLYMMAYIPIYALITKLVFFNIKTFNFTELLVAYLYLQAQITIVSAIISIILIALKVNFMFVGLISIPFMVLYVAYALKRLYQISTPGIILRTVGFSAILFSIFVIVSIGFAFWMFFTESGQEMIEAQKVINEAAKYKN